METLSDRLSDEGWQELLSWLPPNLDEMAQDSGAMQRKREVRHAELLLRMVLAYSVLDLSMRGVSAWMAQQGLADISDVAVLKRLRAAPAFLQQVLAWLLQQSLPPLSPPGELPYRVLLGDATALCGPGATGTDWRVHLGYDVARGLIYSVQLTDGRGQEQLQRVAAGPGDLQVHDRGYARAKDIVALRQTGAHLLVRLGHSSVKLYDEHGKPVDVLRWAARKRRGAGRPPRIEERPVRVRVEDTSVQARLIAIRRSRAQTEYERQRLRKRAQRTGKQLSARSLQAAAYVWFLTTVPATEASGVQLAELYRVPGRWSCCSSG
jgi:hypothetical protein